MAFRWRCFRLNQYQPDRKADNPISFLKGFRGYLHTDGYQAYGKLENVTLVGCWAHARRKFDKAVKALPKSQQKTSSAGIGLLYCSRLFEIENRIAELSPEERKKQRQSQAKPILDAILAWVKTRNAAPKSALGQALHYLVEQWPRLIHYLDDGRLEISNNLAGVGRESILQWINKRNMPAYKVGRLWKFKLSEIDKWIRSGGASEESNTEDNEQA
ncbi:IS66 family transposase [Caproiciproducens galactitolivorans]|uniref:Transposase n=1 Tax=Caproiciproducens galactitolivorans TaxID=642589 RepID=A0ABT4BRQ7_9FIRM|nr:transposase [Caproiciproducens galactitolivorans]MCY1713584.1 transposase [Caproiciproducens galactitolivorans]